jgi:D-alanine transaminase
MQRGAKELGLEGGVPSLSEWEGICSELIRVEGLSDGLLYAQVTGGAAPREFVPAAEPERTFFAYLSPFTFPTDAQVVRGIRAISVRDLRWSRRDLKTTMLLAAVLAKREALRSGANDAILVGPSEEVYEAASSNVFSLEGRTLLTPAQTANLLPGTMRSVVADVAREAGLDARGEPLTLERLRKADEVLVTSTSQLVMPVVELDGEKVGAGVAGPVARDLAARLRVRFGLSS